MEFFQKALVSKKSTIIYSHYGRYPNLVKFYLDSIPELEPVSDYELTFLYRPNLYESRLLHIVIEPSFDAIIPSDVWTIVLSSHLQLFWNPLYTQVIKCDKIFDISQPTDDLSDMEAMVPPTNHAWPFCEKIENTRIDLSDVENCHEAYLKILTAMDLLSTTSKWHLSIGENLRQNLLKKLKPDYSNRQLLLILG